MKKDLRNKALADLTILRNKNISLLKNISEEKSHVIPDTFANNLYWQAGHIVTTQISLLYRRSNLEMPIIDKNYLTYFSKGSSPSDFDKNIPTFATLISQLGEAITLLEKDVHTFADVSYSEPVNVSFGMTLNSFHDAVLAIPYHEAYHMNAINLLLKRINSDNI